MTMPIARCATLLALLGTAAVRADTITLKRSAMLDPHATVTLAHIADLDGPHAISLADTVLATQCADLPAERLGESPMYRIDPGMVRDALDASGGVNWAFLSVRGGTVSITSSRTDRPTPANTDPDRAGVGTEHVPISVVPEGSIGAVARDVVRTILRARDEDLRIVWPERHADFVFEPVAGRAVHVKPIGTSERMPLSVTVYDGDRIVRTETVRAEISIRRTTHTASRVLTRGTPIGPDDFTTREIWTAPGLDPAGEIVGQVTARRLEPGTLIEADDVRPPIVIERGEQITLHCISGAVAIRSPARALGDARDGETLVVEMAGTGRRVMARANGAGNAVLVVRSNQPTQSPQPGAHQ